MNKEYLTLQEFALKLGKSAQTIRRMIKKGEVKAQRMRTPQGFNYMIYCGVDKENSPIQPAIHSPIQKADLQVNELDEVDNENDYYVIDEMNSSPAPVDMQTLVNLLELHHKEKMMLIHILEAMQVELNRAKIPQRSIFARILNWFK